MKLYSIDEGVFEIPESFTDRTINTFVLGQPGKSHFNFSISRDVPLPDEQVSAYVERQLGILNKSIKGYKLLQNRPARLGQRHEGIEVYGTWKEGQQVIYQRQAAFFIAAGKVIIFSATSGKAFDATSDRYWQEWLASFH